MTATRLAFSTWGDIYNSQKCQAEQLKRRQKTSAAAPLSATTPAPPATPPQPPTDVASRLRSLRQTRRLVDRIPRHARKQAAESLTRLLEECINNNDVPAWTRLLLFAYDSFSLPPPADKKGKMTAIIKRNLLHGAPDCDTSSRQLPKTGRSQLRKAVERKLQRGDVSGAVRILASEDTVASPIAEIFEVLKTKHPPDRNDADYPTAPTEKNPTATTVTPEEVQRAVTSFPHSSAGGLDGLRPQDLQDMLGPSVGAAATGLADTLTKLATIMLRSKITPAVCPTLYGAALTALRKKDGGIRPITVGNVLRRLAGKIVSHRVMSVMGALVGPAQLGYGIRGGCEAAVHATRTFLEELGNIRVLLKMDFRNAFNTVHRDAMLRAVQTHLPHYFRYVWQMYRYPSQLSFGKFVLESASGVQQGDPLAPLLFCLVTQQLTQSMASPLNTWYLDDGTVGGSVEVVLTDLELVIQKGREVGLDLNLAKCEAFVCGGDQESMAAATARIFNFVPEIGLPTGEDLSLLGSPLLPEGIVSALKEKTATIRLLTGRLEELQAHHALFLLKNCLSASKVMYVILSSPAWKHRDKLQELDDVIRSSLSIITNTAMNDTTWKQATLPVSRGGLGIPRTEERSLPAYLASVFSVAGLISTIVPDADPVAITIDPIQQWSLVTGRPAPLTNLNVQKQWDAPIVDNALLGLMATAGLRDKARLIAVATKESGYWLNALPSCSLETLLNNDAVRISVGKRQGADLCTRHTCRCGCAVETDGHHGLSCLKSAGRHSRHTALNDVISGR